MFLDFISPNIQLETRKTTIILEYTFNQVTCIELFESLLFVLGSQVVRKNPKKPAGILSMLNTPIARENSASLHCQLCHLSDSCAIEGSVAAHYFVTILILSGAFSRP